MRTPDFDQGRFRVAVRQYPDGRLAVVEKGNRDPVYVALAGDRVPPYSYRGEPCASIGQLRLLLAVEVGMVTVDRISISPNSVMVQGERRTIVFPASIGTDGVVTVDPRWSEE